MAAIASYVQIEPDRSANAERATNPPNVSTFMWNENPARELAKREAPSVPQPRMETKSRDLRRDRISTRNPASPTIRFESRASSEEVEAHLPDRNYESPGGRPGQPARRHSRWVVNRVANQQTVVFHGSTQSPQESTPAKSREPVFEHIPAGQPARSESPVREATRGSPSSVSTVARGVSITPERPPWPRGPFTPEEELYRAQFGAQALSAILREEALGPENP